MQQKEVVFQVEKPNQKNERVSTGPSRRYRARENAEGGGDRRGGWIFLLRLALPLKNVLHS
jgi:hypothetical protein